jgi:outer membrane protein OmpA-like peptidoglycan-associated protein
MRKASFFATAMLAAGALFISGCATKTWVQQQVTPIDKKVAEVDANSQKRDAQQVSDLGKTNQMVDEDAKKLSSTTEIARTADNQANGAMSKADKNAKDLGDLRSVIANIDDYKASGAPTVVHFAIGKSVISKDDKAKLDAVASSVGSTQRYFITVEGYTDQTGNALMNDRLSRERADAVIAYLVGSHNIPVYRMHTVGLGQQKLIDEGKGRAAREASRRVEITVYTAKPLTAGM